jgi:hypothetical protein
MLSGGRRGNSRHHPARIGSSCGGRCRLQNVQSIPKFAIRGSFLRSLFSILIPAYAGRHLWARLRDCLPAAHFGGRQQSASTQCGQASGCDFPSSPNSRLAIDNSKFLPLIFSRSVPHFEILIQYLQQAVAL